MPSLSSAPFLWHCIALPFPKSLVLARSLKKNSLGSSPFSLLSPGKRFPRRCLPTDLSRVKERLLEERGSPSLDSPPPFVAQKKKSFFLSREPPCAPASPPKGCECPPNLLYFNLLSIVMILVPLFSGKVCLFPVNLFLRHCFPANYA